MESNIGEIIKNSLESIREITDINTIIGEPIKTDGGTTIIPVSKVSLGFASGGVDFTSKDKQPKNDEPGTVNTNGKNTHPKSFGGGGGTGVTIAPICFLVITPDGRVELLNINNPDGGRSNNIVDSISELLARSPEIIAGFKDAFGVKNGKDDGEDIFNDDKATDQPIENKATASE